MESGSTPGELIERNLGPGEYGMGGRSLRLRTLLGSCVTVTLWHPELRLGGMCHGLVPTRGSLVEDTLDAKYVDEAIHLLVRSLSHGGASSPQLEAKVFGGGNMFDLVGGSVGAHVGHRNVAAARQSLARLGIRVVGDDVLGNFYRMVLFDIATGNVWVRRQVISHRPPK